jgi:hypothetical protein
MIANEPSQFASNTSGLASHLKTVMWQTYHMAVTHSDKFGLRLWAVRDGFVSINAANIMNFIADIYIYVYINSSIPSRQIIRHDRKQLARRERHKQYICINHVVRAFCLG